MDRQKEKRKRQLRRRRHVRNRIVGTGERPRLTVHRSNKHIYAQLIDDLAGKTLAAAMKEANKKYELKIYPAYGDSPQDGHAFGYFGAAVWANDVFEFLSQHSGAVFSSTGRKTCDPQPCILLYAFRQRSAVSIDGYALPSCSIR